MIDMKPMTMTLLMTLLPLAAAHADGDPARGEARFQAPAPSSLPTFL